MTTEPVKATDSEPRFPIRIHVSGKTIHDGPKMWSVEYLSNDEHAAVCAGIEEEHLRAYSDALKSMREEHTAALDSARREIKEEVGKRWDVAHAYELENGSLKQQVEDLRAKLAVAKETLKKAEAVFANGLEDESECTQVWMAISDALATKETQ